MANEIGRVDGEWTQRAGAILPVRRKERDEAATRRFSEELEGTEARRPEPQPEASRPAPQRNDESGEHIDLTA